MTKLEKIMELLADKELTSIEIASKLNIPKNNCASYLNTLKKDGRIVRTNDNIPYRYKLAKKPIELLKQLYEFMSNENKCKIKNYQEKDLELIRTIKEMIK